MKVLTHVYIFADLVHLSTSFQDGARADLKPFIETFLRHDHNDESEDDSKPTILYSAYFEVPASIRGHDYISEQNGPIYSCGGTFCELDYDESIKQSRMLYSKMYPDDEFLPKAPEPEEIIIGDTEDDREGTVNLGVLADLIAESTETSEIKSSNDAKEDEETSQTQ
jgi:hypothetical protein